MANGFFITGTDTGVGKTIITAALLKTAQHLGFKAVGMKPIETGCRKTVGSRLHTEYRKDFLIPSDGQFLRDISGTDESLDLITPVRFEHPLAPMPASEIEGTAVDMEKITTAFRTLTLTYDVLIIEGIGGIMVPITKDYSVLDMAKVFDLPMIVVARPGIGTLNHTLLAVNVAVKEGLTVAGVIINYTHPPEGTMAERTNPSVLVKVCPAPVLGILPYLENLEQNAMKEAALRNLSLDILKKYLI